VPQRQCIVCATSHRQVIGVGVDAFDEKLRQARGAYRNEQLVDDVSCATAVTRLHDERPM
jgi:hypothetical protein